MSSPQTLPSVPELKVQARRLRDSLAKDGDFISHAESLEYLAHQFGMRDWNTLHARAKAGQVDPDKVQLGSRIHAIYLGHAIRGEVTSIRHTNAMKHALRLHLDEPVDVVASAHFSSFRSRISVTIDGEGKSVEKTGNGAPHFILTTIE